MPGLDPGVQVPNRCLGRRALSLVGHEQRLGGGIGQRLLERLR
jgi:hypothetical protein